MQKILLFNIKNEKLNSIMQIASVKKIKVENIERKYFENTLIDVVNKNYVKISENIENFFNDEMIIFCDVLENNFNYILTTLKSKKIIVNLKAVLTNNNKEWSIVELNKQLNSERLAYLEYLKNKK